MSTVETVDMSNDPRYKMGREAGRFDRGEEFESDMPYFHEEIERLVGAKYVNWKWIGGQLEVSSFSSIDPAYVQGYEVGYQEGPQKKTTRKPKRKG